MTAISDSGYMESLQSQSCQIKKGCSYYTLRLQKRGGFEFDFKTAVWLLYAITAQQIICHNYGFFYYRKSGILLYYDFQCFNQFSKSSAVNIMFSSESSITIRKFSESPLSGVYSVEKYILLPFGNHSGICRGDIISSVICPVVSL